MQRHLFYCKAVAATAASHEYRASVNFHVLADTIVTVGFEGWRHTRSQPETARYEYAVRVGIAFKVSVTEG
jgi:hypothetical protein